MSDNEQRREIWNAARTHAFDTYLAALVAPRAVREDLVVLAAFLGETARIPFLVSDPTLGDIRLQWWRDWLAGVGEATTPTGNALADTFAGVVRRHHLPAQRIVALLDARADEGYAGGFGDDAIFQKHLMATTGTGIALAVRVLGAEETPDVTTFLGDATEAIGTVAILRRLPKFVSRGRWPLPVEVVKSKDARLSQDDFLHDTAAERQASIDCAIARVRAALGRAQSCSPNVSRDVQQAVLELALVEPYLHVLDSVDCDPVTEFADIAPLTRVWRLWRARLSGRL